MSVIKGNYNHKDSNPTLQAIASYCSLLYSPLSLTNSSLQMFYYKLANTYLSSPFCKDSHIDWSFYVSYTVKNHFFKHGQQGYPILKFQLDGFYDSAEGLCMAIIIFCGLWEVGYTGHSISMQTGDSSPNPKLQLPNSTGFPSLHFFSSS